MKATVSLAALNLGLTGAGDRSSSFRCSTLCPQGAPSASLRCWISGTLASTGHRHVIVPCLVMVPRASPCSPRPILRHRKMRFLDVPLPTVACLLASLRDEALSATLSAIFLDNSVTR
ncbi:unnamed protein product [Urochloa humidicola]